MTVQEEAKAYKKFRNEEALEYCRKQAMLEQVVGNENWKHYNTAAKALEEVEQYRALGTVEELKEAREFKKYFDELYGEGLDVANWHKNGDLEPFDSFYESALEWGEEE